MTPSVKMLNTKTPNIDQELSYSDLPNQTKGFFRFGSESPGRLLPIPHQSAELRAIGTASQVASSLDASSVRGRLVGHRIPCFGMSPGT